MNNDIAKYEELFSNIIPDPDDSFYNEDNFDDYYDDLYCSLDSYSYKKFEILNLLYGLSIINKDNISLPDYALKLEKANNIKLQILINVAKNYGWTYIKLHENINEALETITNIQLYLNNVYLNNNSKKYSFGKIEIEAIHDIMNGIDINNVYKSIFNHFDITNITDLNLINVLSGTYMEYGHIPSAILFEKVGTTNINMEDMQQLSFFNTMYDIPAFVINNDTKSYIGIIGFELYNEYFIADTLDFLNCAAYYIFNKDVL